MLTATTNANDSPASARIREAGPLLLYDGVCGLCNRMVRFVLRFDRLGMMRFATLAGPFGDAARTMYPGVAGVDSIVFLHQGRQYVRSAAALEVARLMGGVWRLAALGYVIPRPLRDALYDWVARNRYGWFGKLDACPLPAPNERERFL